jgi:hypothetical protein
MSHSSFIVDARQQLRWLNRRLEKAGGTDRRALEGARRELIELIQSANNVAEKQVVCRTAAARRGGQES